MMMKVKWKNIREYTIRVRNLLVWESTLWRNVKGLLESDLIIHENAFEAHLVLCFVQMGKRNKI